MQQRERDSSWVNEIDSPVTTYFDVERVMVRYVGLIMKMIAGIHHGRGHTGETDVLMLKNFIDKNMREETYENKD